MFTILVAEDDRSLNKIISTKLKQENFNVHSVFNGQEALDVMESHQLHLYFVKLTKPS
ncbi:hypothetical protein [Streptococcus iniae]|uniref:hypothetical protein n=1 Tax=Streptococcus iniae TaxID=1346 RepID=UPI0035C6A466